MTSAGGSPWPGLRRLSPTPTLIQYSHLSMTAFAAASLDAEPVSIAVPAACVDEFTTPPVEGSRPTGIMAFTLKASTQTADVASVAIQIDRCRRFRCGNRHICALRCAKLCRKPGLVTLLRTFAATSVLWSCVLIFFDSTAPRTQVTPHFIYRFRLQARSPSLSCCSWVRSSLLVCFAGSCLLASGALGDTLHFR